MILILGSNWSKLLYGLASARESCVVSYAEFVTWCNDLSLHLGPQIQVGSGAPVFVAALQQGKVHGRIVLMSVAAYS